jgi:plastocyanin
MGTAFMRIKSIFILTAVVVVFGARAATTTIDQSGQQFSEKTAALKTGDSLVFSNHDDVTHNVNIIDDDEEATDLGLQKPGEKLTYKFDKGGRFKARCSIHPGMKMTINVK